MEPVLKPRVRRQREMGRTGKSVGQGEMWEVPEKMEELEQNDGEAG